VQQQTKEKMMAKKQNRKHRTSSAPRTRVWPAFLLLGLLGGLMVLMIHARAPGGELNAQGLRVSGEGRSDASHVTPPELFEHPRVKAACTIAQEIPETMNHLYCWCGCIERGMRSALECFESNHGATCDVCIRTAEIAWKMTQQGVTDPGEIQRTIDTRLGRV
jgi:hypothetical protein